MRSLASSVSLEKVADINPSLPLAPESDDEVAFVPMSAVDEDSTDVIECDARPYYEVRKGYTPFIRNDVLVAKITPCFENGKIALANLTRPVGFGSTEFHVVRPRKDVLDPRYLVHFLRQERIRTEGARRMTGSGGQRRVPSHFVAGLSIPLPPLPEQRRIAAILDQADELRAKRRSALAQLDALAQSIFVDMFGDPATNPKGWPVRSVEDVAEIVSGATPRTDVPEYWEGDVSWVTPKELSGLEGIYIDRTERRITEAGLQSCAATVMPAGAVLFSSRAPIGHTAICAAPMATNQGFKSFVPRAGLLDEHFLLHWLRLRREFLEGLGTGATFKEVSKAVVSRVRIVLPPMPMQKKFAQAATHVETLRKRGIASLRLVCEQFDTLQDRAFRGEL